MATLCANFTFLPVAKTNHINMLLKNTKTFWLHISLPVPVNFIKAKKMLLGNLSSVAIINKFLHGAPRHGWASGWGAAGVQTTDHYPEWKASPGSQLK